MAEPEEKTEPDRSGRRKKTYRKPHLITYGDIREITPTLGETGDSDLLSKTGK